MGNIVFMGLRKIDKPRTVEVSQGELHCCVPFLIHVDKKSLKKPKG
jgi:hypothetical protein